MTTAAAAPARPRRRGRRLGRISLFLVATVLAPIALAGTAFAVTTGNGALVYSPAAGTSFNPEGGRAAGTTYAKMIVFKNSGSSNGVTQAALGGWAGRR